MKKWQKVNSKVVYTNPWLTLHEDEIINPEGKKGIYGVIERKPSVFIIPVTEKNEIFLIKIERYTTNEEGWEVPAGGLSDGEDIKQAAERELSEETGIIAQELLIAGEFQSINSISNQIAYTVVAKDLQYSANNQQHKEGIERIKKVNLSELRQMIKSGEIKDGQSITALSQALLFLDLI